VEIVVAPAGTESVTGVFGMANEGAGTGKAAVVGMVAAAFGGVVAAAAVAVVGAGVMETAAEEACELK
jgi:hypothetical protein